MNIPMYLQVIPFEDEHKYFKHYGHDSGLDLGHAQGGTSFRTITAFSF